MPDKKERRSGQERRTTKDHPARRKDRRGGDRRDSPRIPIKFLVRQTDAGGDFEERDGDISVGGVSFKEKNLPSGVAVELRFKFPEYLADIRATGKIVRVSGREGNYGAHVQFDELDTRDELAIARYIDDRVLAGDETVD